MWVKFRHKVFHFFFRRPVYLLFRIKYGFRAKKYKLPKGPHLILFNHVSNFDPIFVGVSLTRPVYYIANEDLFNIPFWSKVLNYLVAPIPKQKSMRDTTTIRTSLKVIKEGGNIGVAPEGNRNYSGTLNHIDMAIVKFAKLLKVPVVLYTISGAFGVNPRFAVDIRKGKQFGKVAKIISVEEVKAMSNEELLDLIYQVLDVDDSTLGLDYKGKNLAEHLESVFYVCPVCNDFHTIYSKVNEIGCHNCDFKAEYTTKLLFETNDERFKFKNIKEYYRFQDDYIRQYDFKSLSYEDNEIMILEANANEKRKELFKGKLLINKDKLVISNELEHKEFLLSEISSLAVVYHNTIIVNLESEKYHLVGSPKFNALKYIHLFTLLKAEEKGESYEFLGI